MSLIYTFSFVFLYPRHGSVCFTIKVMLPNITVLLHSYSPFHSPHAQSTADKLAMCHGYPQSHKTVTAACRIIFPLHSSPCQTVAFSVLLPSSLLTVILSLPIDVLYYSQFILITQQTNSTQCNTQYPKPHLTSLLPN